MTKKQKNLGELELLILKTVWDTPDCTVQEIADVVNLQRAVARTTVLTVMQRLQAKGFLKRRKKKGIYRYSPTKERNNVLSGVIGQFVDRMLDGSSAPFLAYMADNEDLTEEQATQLRDIVEQLEEKEGSSTDE
jgi:predicted transcriptional regulator